MRSDLVGLIDAIAIINGTVAIRSLEPAERDALATKAVWSYSDRRAPQTVIRFGDAVFRPKDAQTSVIIDTGSPEYDYELKAILLLLYHIGTREGATPYKWTCVNSRIRTLGHFARYCFNRGHQSFRDLNDMPPILVRALLFQFLNANRVSGGMDLSRCTSAAKTFREAAQHIADYEVVTSRQLMPLLDEVTQARILSHKDEHHLRHTVIPTAVMKKLIAEASTYVVRAEQQYCHLVALMDEVNVALVLTKSRGRNAFGGSFNRMAQKSLYALLKNYFVDLRRHVYVLVLAFTGMRDGEAYELKTGSSGVRAEAGESVYYVKSLLSKGADEVVELDWIANSIVHEAISLLSQVNFLFYQRAELILAYHRAKLAAEQIHRLELGIREKNLFGVRCVSLGFNFFVWSSRANGNRDTKLSLGRYEIPVTKKDIEQLERLGCNYRSVATRSGMRGRPYKVGDRFNLTPHQFRHTFAWFIVGNRFGDIDDIRYQFKHLTQAMTLVYSERAYQTFDDLRAAIEYFETLVNQQAINEIVQSAGRGQIAGGGGERIMRLLNDLNDDQDGEQFSTVDQPHFRNGRELAEFAACHSGDIRGLPHGYCTKGASCKIRNAADPSHCLYCDTYFATKKHLPYWRIIERNCESRIQEICAMPVSVQKRFVAYRQTLEDNLYAARCIIEQLAPADEPKKEAH